MDIFDHARCRTAGWAEQVYIKCEVVVLKCKRLAFTESVFPFKVINQWEMCGQQVNKLKKIDESRASARRFCK